MKQIALALYDNSDSSFSDVVPHPGISGAMQALQASFGSHVKAPPHIFIHGPAGSGKTLLIKALNNLLRSERQGGTSRVILTQMSDPNSEFHGLESVVAMSRDEVSLLAAVLIDDVDKVPDSEANHLWNLWNQLITTGAGLVCSSTVGPELIFPENRHLSSRMISGLSLELTPPDDSARVLILDRMAKKRGVRLTHDVISYLLSRKSRNLKTLEDILLTLDQVSLEEKRRVTLKLIKDLEAEGLV
jgi:DnaA-homolog protein